ncbi:hypothetical protein JVU11DRAFT_10730 [Chiua virens]|nr:hypothetical protein JVU11DRAFT_10730 [Chiua virens]
MTTVANAQLAAVILLLESMTLTPEQAASINSTIHTDGSTALNSAAPAAPPAIADASSATADAPMNIVTPNITQQGAIDSPLAGPPNAADQPPMAPTAQGPDPVNNTADQSPVIAVAAQGLITATILQQLPIHTIMVGGEVVFQHIYRGISFDIPHEGSTGPFYLMTRGLRIGVFSTWNVTVPHVLAISSTSFHHVQTLNSGLVAMLHAIEVGAVQMPMLL